jgi:uncharacterized protein (DUF362 family)
MVKRDGEWREHRDAADAAKDRVSRRQFLKGTVGTVVAASLAGKFAEKAIAEGAKKARVILLQDPAYFQDRKPDGAVARKMVDRIMCALTGKSSPGDAWKALFSPKEKIAIKVNCLFPPVTTNPETVQAVVESMADAGFDPTRIIIFDRSDRDLTKCGFTINESSKGAKCYGTKEYVFPAKARDVDTKLSSILVNDVDALINMPVLKHHGISGITASLKNHLGTIPNPGALHSDNCSRLAELNALEPIKKKTRLILMDAARAQYDRGPSFSPQQMWSYSGMLASTDPIAMDVIAAKEILAKRNASGQEGPIRPPIKHIELGATLGLGVGDLNQIDAVTLKV